MDLEDKLLVLKFNRGDRAALRRIYTKYKDYLVTLAGALLFETSQAQDVVHDVFQQFMQQAGTFRLTGSLRGYLATCVANHARNGNRRRQRQDRARTSEAEPVGADPIEQMVMTEENRCIARALGQLPEEQREVVALRIYGEQRFPAIARIQGVSVNTVEGRFRYAVKKLRMLLSPEEIG